MTTDLDKANARLAGMQAFNEGRNFAQSPYEGFREDDIELRWQWQLGWLRAQQDKWDAEKPKTKS